MSFIKWHKNYAKKSLNMFGLSTYQGFWISFIKGLILGAIIMWFVGCKETVVIKNAPKNLEVSNIESSDYSIGVKGNCGMCKYTIEQAVKDLDFVFLRPIIVVTAFKSPTQNELDDPRPVPAGISAIVVISIGKSILNILKTSRTIG